MITIIIQKSFIFIVFITLALALEFEQSEVNAPQIYGDIFPEKSRSLFLLSQNSPLNKHKCQREVPAIFFQTKKNESIRGNGSTIFYHRLEVCCEGYTRSSYDWRICLPDCSQISSNNCRNGFCRSPNKCECFEEFILNDHGECVHTCPIQCENGHCFLNGTCACRHGYILDHRNRKFCRPECPLGCGNNQECIEPGKCECKRGYNWTKEYGCQPICTPDCGYGKCVGPNICECFPGYTKRPQRNVCEAGCYINCENGFCESHYKCQCRDGYKYDAQTTSCLPNCGDSCENGVCIAPGVCKCFDGYELKGGSCEPICNGGCGNYSRCTDVNTCSCVSTLQRCLMGTCDHLGRCRCKRGYTHFVDRCVQQRNLQDLITTYDQREHFNKALKLEFEAIIGYLFKFLSEDISSPNITNLYI